MPCHVYSLWKIVETQPKNWTFKNFHNMQETSLCGYQSFQTILHTTAVTTTTTTAVTATTTATAAESKSETKSNQFPEFFGSNIFK